MAEHNDIGRRGEEEATRLLASKGYHILERNWRFYGYEIDIVAQNSEYIIFVEVKTRTSAQWGNPEDFVGKSRMRRMVEAAHHYLIENNRLEQARFDIIGAVWNGNTFEMEHIEDAFLAF